MADPFEGWSDEPAPTDSTPAAFTGWKDEPPAPSEVPDPDALLKGTFERALRTAPDKRAGVLRLAGELKLPSDIAEKRFDDFQRTWEASQFDPKAWRAANPELAKLALERPDLGEVVIRERVPIVTNPLKPGESRVFRLPFDDIPSGWNNQMPQLVIARIEFT